MHTLSQVLEIIPAPTTISDAYNAGYDCGKHGPNDRNSHYGLFSTREKTRTWELGKQDAEAGREPQELA